jgi:hypothetical protein
VRVLPSQIAQAIENLVGVAATEIAPRRLTPNYLAEINGILTLLNDVPTELISLPFAEYLELTRCRAVLAAATAHWALGGVVPARNVGGKDPLERVRRLMQQCQDELPPPEPELPFIEDADRRAGIEDQLNTAWSNFRAQNWLGATTFAGAASEAILLWAIEKSTSAGGAKYKKPPNEMTLFELIDESRKRELISNDTATLAHMTRDARNLIHPGKVSRSGVSCTRASALTALAGLYRIVEEIKTSSKLR